MKKLILLLSLCYLCLFAQPKYYAKFEYNKQTAYGQIQGNKIQPLSQSIFQNPIAKGQAIALKDVKLLIPTTPQKVFAVGMNFASHIPSSYDAPPPLFLKLPSSLIASKQTVFFPKDAKNVHFEGELVIIIGKKAKNITQEEAKEVIFGVTVGNDLTERNWQGRDLQWLRAKASDGFSPIGSVIAVGVDYNNLLLQTKLNGKIVQEENTKNMIHKPKKVVSYLSQYFTLMPGDLIYMGTPGRTQALKNEDTISVSIEKIGTVENRIKH